MAVEFARPFTRVTRNNSLPRPFRPLATVRCSGPAVFRSQSARDLACLLDTNRDIDSWACMPDVFDLGDRHHVPDFRVVRCDGQKMYVDAPDRTGSVDTHAIAEAAQSRGARYRLALRGEVYDGAGLRNARDILRYGDYQTPLGDRIRVLAALDEHGSLSFAECLQIFKESRAVAGLSSLILDRFVAVDLDEAILGPETVVRRISL